MRGIKILSTVCAVILPAAFLFAAGSGFTGGAFDDDGIAVRPLGMGGAFTAVTDDANASWWNPAGLALLGKKRSTSFTYVPDMFKMTNDKMSNFFLAYGQGDTNGFGALGGTIDFMSAKLGAETDGDKEYSWNEYTVALSWGMEIQQYLSLPKYAYPKILIGANVKYMGVKSDLPASGSVIDASGFGADVSLMAALKENLNIALMGKNVFTQIKWNTGTTEKLPYSLRAGVFYGITAGFIVAADIKAIEDYKGTPVLAEYNGGAEYLFDFGKTSQIQKLGVRAGVAYDPANDALALSGGGSAYMESFSVDYTFRYHIKTLVDDTHRMGITLNF